MLQDRTTEPARVNARKTDAFDIFNFRYYTGPNPYLDTAALVFDFAVTNYTQPRSLEEYVSLIGDRYPHLRNETYDSYARLFGRTVSEVGKLDMGLHFKHWSVKPCPNYERISVQSLHARNDFKAYT